jgi:hypothetical protein
MSDWIIAYAAGVVTGIATQSLGWPWYWTAAVLALVSVRIIYVAIREVL